MDEAIARGLGIKIDAARSLIRQAGSPERAAEEILAWGPADLPDGVRYVNREWIERGIRVERLKPWAAKWKAEEFVRSATLFELRISMEANPTYPCLAGFKGVTLPACLDLAKSLGHTLSDDKLAYAVAMTAIRASRSVTKEQVFRTLTQYGARHVDPATAVPFHPELMIDHPLSGIQPDDARLSHIPPDWPRHSAYGTGLDLVRERKNMQNRISRVGDTYKLREGVGNFVDMILALNARGPPQTGEWSGPSDTRTSGT
jgi:hypothetical protein